MIILGNHFDGINYVIEDTKNNNKIELTKENILNILK